MLFSNTITVALLLAGVGCAAHLPSSYALHEKRTLVPSEWAKRSKAPQDMKLPVRIHLSPQNADFGHDHLMAISDPSSPDFGNHWTPEQVHDFFSPSKEAVLAVQEWLASSGIPPHKHKIPSSRGHIQFEASVDEMESLLKTDYDVWEHLDTGSVSISCDEYHLPQSIKHHIDFIRPTISLGTPRAAISRKQKRDSQFGPLSISAPEVVSNATNLSLCYQSISPECIRALYDVPAPTTAVKGNEMGIFESGDVYDQPDLDAFFTQFAPNIPNGTHPILKSIDGGTAPVPQSLNAGSESALDFDLAFPLIYPQKIKLYQTLDQYADALGIFDPFLDALDASYCSYDGGDNPKYDPTLPDAGYNGTRQCGIYKPTHVISVSYEIAEASFSPAYEIRQCHEYLKLGLMGTSIIFSSGDNGTLSRSGVDGCLENGAQNPGSPSTCPYVTSVGATQLPEGANVTDQEVAVNPLNQNPFGLPAEDWPQFSSGGGFSNVFPRPSYQEDAVSSFLYSNANASQLPSSSTYNQLGRAFPDVSANGWNIASYFDGVYNPESGTSASAPIFASIINRLNEERILAGKKAVGFLNPIFYANPWMFNDITDGYNLGCNGVAAFYCTEGWDPVTGLGTPNYGRMKEVFMALP